jgi:rare lipoprotein A
MKDVGGVALILAGLAFAAILILVQAPTVTLGLTPLPAPGRAFYPPVSPEVASWYGEPFHGRKTASGVTYDMGGYSVAHKTVAMGTFVLITNLDNGRWCVAVVNDRGPYVKGRDWDVSAAVAGRLGMVKNGLAPVKVKVIDGY